jgi:hypothetical protein
MALAFPWMLAAFAFSMPLAFAFAFTFTLAFATFAIPFAMQMGMRRWGKPVMGCPIGHNNNAGRILLMLIV